MIYSETPIVQRLLLSSLFIVLTNIVYMRCYSLCVELYLGYVYFTLFVRRM